MSRAMAGPQSQPELTYNEYQVPGLEVRPQEHDAPQIRPSGSEKELFISGQAAAVERPPPGSGTARRRKLKVIIAAVSASVVILVLIGVLAGVLTRRNHGAE